MPVLSAIDANLFNVLQVALSIVGVALLIALWRPVASLSMLTRSLLAVLVLLGVGAFSVYVLKVPLPEDWPIPGRMAETRSAPPAPKPSVPAPPKADSAPGSGAPQQSTEVPPPARGLDQAEERARKDEAAKRSETEARRRMEDENRRLAEKPAAPEAAAPAPRAAAPEPAPAPAPDLGATTGAEPPASSRGLGRAEEKKEPDWDVVPVFYGTDRAVEATKPRLAYSSDRGRRLELGRALVTVPRIHQVPNIERPWVLQVPFVSIKLYAEDEDPKKHFTIQEIRALDREEMLRLVAERLAASNRYKGHALIFVHGYNTSFDGALYRSAQISYDLKFDGASFVYSWPSVGKIGSYTYDRASAEQAAPFLREYIELVGRETGATSVSIIAHSMGNEPLLRVLRELQLASPAGIAINQVILAAPDVDRDSFDNLARAISSMAKGVTLYAAANDRALLVSKNFHGGVPRAGDVPAEGPVILPGVDTIDVTDVSTDSVGLHHSGYAENNTLLSDIGRLILTGIRPPEARLADMKRLKTAKGSDYWRFSTMAPATTPPSTIDKKGTNPVGSDTLGGGGVAAPVGERAPMPTPPAAGVAPR